MAEQKAAGKRKSTMKKVWYYLKNYRFLLIVSVVMAAVTVAGTLYVPILVGDAIDYIIKKGHKCPPLKNNIYSHFPPFLINIT